MKDVCMMKWYEPLIWYEFISYFSDESVSYFSIVNGERVGDDMLENYREVVLGLTTGDNSIRLKYEADFIEYLIEEMSEYRYRAFMHYVQCKDEPGIIGNIWKCEFSTFFRDQNVDMERMSADELAACIMYPFWGRWGSDYIDNLNLENGRLKDAVLMLAKKESF